MVAVAECPVTAAVVTQEWVVASVDLDLVVVPQDSVAESVAVCLDLVVESVAVCPDSVAEAVCPDLAAVAVAA